MAPSRPYISDPRYRRRLQDVVDAAVDGASSRGTPGAGSPHATGTASAVAAVGGDSTPRAAAGEGSTHATGTSSDAEAAYNGVIFGTAPAEPAHLNARTLSTFLHDAAGRGTPSERNFLKNTEIHVISRPLPGLSDRGFVAHYLRNSHSLELRAEFNLPEDFLGEGIACEGWFLVGFSTAFTPLPRRVGSTNGSADALDRNIELGHAVGSVALAAAALGWEARLLGPSLGYEALKRLLGLRSGTDLVNEMPAAVILVFRRPPDNPEVAVLSVPALKSKIIGLFNDSIQWRGCPCSVNSPNERTDYLCRSLIWTEMTDGAEHVRLEKMLPGFTGEGYEYKPPATLRQALNSRGSIPVADFDESYSTSLADFQQFVLRCCPGDITETDAGRRGSCFPHGVLPWLPRVNVFFYVNRVEGLEPGVYCLVRNRRHFELDPEAELGAAAAATSSSDVSFRYPPYLWRPTTLGHQALGAFYLFRQQDDSVPPPCFNVEHKKSSFVVAMVAPYLDVMKQSYFMYSRQMWEAGFLGEVLAVEAQAQGVSAHMIPSKDYHYGFMQTALSINKENGEVICAYAVGNDKQEDENMVLKALGCFCPCFGPCASAFEN